ncbi:c-type cytochrome [Methylobacterium nonmethylotrophicum]|uniref:Cytochrome c n=1 Tax=Methylobacterium nonmethylotrophicum TaxID=1141884 RepID=A0A4Z0NSS5_9HYPH|nr:cytochrome c [Methylobacterium nonmethylotrophicum]TGE00080.1 cytochrome c [Methylobacterium nonmethylotrophicum]
MNAPPRLVLAHLVLGLSLAACPAAADPARLALGKRVFTELAEPQCGICHTLADAGTKGEVGPSLDTLKPDAARVATAVTNGIGVMPAFEALTPEQVAAVAGYVASVTGATR